MTQFEKFQEVLQEMGLPFTLTDDSEEYPIDEYYDKEIPNTVVMIKDEGGGEDFTYDIAFMFHKDGSFKEVVVF